ncbi:hypothetical protein SAMN05216353_14429, partial [Halobacillus alkaliphilus]
MLTYRTEVREVSLAARCWSWIALIVVYVLI